ncbi:MAG TPA: DMT family transporter [Acidimicrobiia bacterium]|nr:DMT family transporter [Acidimicrobiia bacterium]
MKAWSYIVAAGIIFGLGGPTTKFLIGEGLDPVFLTGVVFALAATAALLLHKRFGALPARGWWWAMLIGMVSGSGPAIFFNLGFQRLPVSITTVLISSGPIFTSVAAHYLGPSDRFTLLKGLGLLLSFGGVFLLAGSPAAAGSLAGIALTMTGAAMSGLSGPFVKRLAMFYGPAATLAPMLTGAGILGIATVALTGTWQTPTAFQWGLILALAITLAMAFMAVLGANRLAPASQASLFAYIIPLVGVLVGVLAFEEPVGWRLIVGGLAVLGGVVLVGLRTEVREAKDDGMRVS